MNIIPVDPDRLTHPGVAAYFTRNPHRMAAVRAMLDLLSIPFPNWAERDISGPGAARNMLAAYRADNPETLAQATARKLRERGVIDTSFLG